MFFSLTSGGLRRVVPTMSLKLIPPFRDPAARSLPHSRTAQEQHQVRVQRVRQREMPQDNSIFLKTDVRVTPAVAVHGVSVPAVQQVHKSSHLFSGGRIV